VTGSWLTVKEQMPHTYASRLAALGCTAFTFDFTGFGQSGGAARQLEHPDDRAGMFFELDYYASPRRGAVPAWKNEMAEMSWLHWLMFDGLRAAREVRVPTVNTSRPGFPCAKRRPLDHLQRDVLSPHRASGIHERRGFHNQRARPPQP
jgi:hypothetical protein